ncbi:autotransporter outer membrane beta-barrel domain-containing protein [Bordetella sp. N]|uniref:autotransporter family protein n=1 Tax=Bordetella sp. N TaxID=1746199 RepID=UPI0018D1F938|nr:autotransporter outer membrane beta-barrel domain-containing protein [Bordetella sp. N]
MQYGVNAPAGAAIGTIQIDAGGSIQLANDVSGNNPLFGIFVNAPTLDSFVNNGTVQIVPYPGRPVTARAVEIDNTTIAQNFTNNGTLDSSSDDYTVLAFNTTINGSFHNGTAGVIQNHATAAVTYVLGFYNVSIHGDFVNDGVIRSLTPGVDSQVFFAGGSVDGDISNTGTMSTLLLSSTQVGGTLSNSGTASRILLQSGAQVGSLLNTASGTAQTLSIQDSVVMHGIRNEGTITNPLVGSSGILLVNGGVTDGGITNTSTGQINSANGIALNSATPMTGDIVNAGTINSTDTGIRVTAGAPLNGDIINSGTITGGSGYGIFLGSGGTLTGRIVNAGTINTASGIALFTASAVGSIENRGTIAGGAFGIRVENSTVTGGIDNSGTITAPTAIYIVAPTAPIVVTNTGMLDGKVVLDTATLNVNGGAITGTITGAGATVNINTDFTPAAAINVAQVNVNAGHTLTLAGTSVNGAMAVANGATLAGNGSVGTTNLASGGTLSPGTAAIPVGTLAVNGDLTFAPGSAYRVDAGPGTSTDSVHVTGAANLAGSVLHVGASGDYAASTLYKILRADGGLNGRFDSVSSNLAYLAPTLSYDAHDVTMDVELKRVPVDPGDGGGDAGGGSGETGSGGGETGAGSGTPTRPIRFADLAMTGNQRSVANALQSLPTSNGLYSRVLNLPEGAPPAVFASLSGESFASTVSGLQSLGGNVVNLPKLHLRANMDAGQLPGPAIAQLGGGNASALPQSGAQPMWAQVFGNWRTLEGDGNAAKSRQTDGGLFVGGDHGVGSGWRLGGALGYTNTHISVDDASSTANIDSYSAVVYGGKAFQAGAGKINLTLGTAYTWHDVKSQRNVDAAGDNQTLKASYGASTAQFFTELGYALKLNDRVGLEPFVAADYSDLRMRGFSESGGDAALSGASSRNRLGTSTLGLHARTSFDVGQSAASLHGTIGWRHAYGDVHPEATLSFDGSQAFTVAGAPIARNATVVELGAEIAMNQYATLGVAYNGQFGAGNQQNAGTLTMNWRF